MLRQQALGIMLAFAERTGLSSARRPERYLWTDAFAVCNLLTLGRRDLALDLVRHVHQILGQHRADDPRSGWLSGLSDEEAEAHPTRGGLRIGKELLERAAGDAFDERLEWQRDGQYFHYLTKWMHALDQAAWASGDARYNLWARELADVAHRSFTYFEPHGRGGRRMHWKMSVDLSRPLVAAMGQYDPLDGYVTCLQLERTAERLGVADVGPPLADAVADLQAMVPDDVATADPLGIGGLLTDAARLEQLGREGAPVDQRLAESIVEAAEMGLTAFVGGGELGLPAEYRLAFRELGLAIGLAGPDLLGGRAAPLERFASLRQEIVAFWSDPENRAVASWREHLNINEVMLATALVPDGLLLPGG